MKKQKFAIYIKTIIGLEKVTHIYNTIQEAAEICGALNTINPCGAPRYFVKPVTTYTED